MDRSKFYLFCGCALLLILASVSVMKERYLKSHLTKNHFISFAESMAKRDAKLRPHSLLKRFARKSRWKLVKNLYEKNILQAPYSKELRIPKIIHQIWLGSPLPEKYKAISKKWQELHPDWEYHFWDDEKASKLTLKCRELFDTAISPAEKADILRYELLDQFGGVYADTDYEPLKPFDPLNHLCDFYVGLETIEKTSPSPRIGNAIIGSIPHHPIIDYTLRKLSGEGSRSDPDGIQKRTGPIHFTKCFLKKARDKRLKNVALPFTYLYPLPATMREEGKEKWIKEESFGVHYWEASWVR